MTTFNFKVVNKQNGNDRLLNGRANDQKHAINKSKFYLEENETIVY